MFCQFCRPMREEWGLLQTPTPISAKLRRKNPMAPASFAKPVSLPILFVTTIMLGSMVSGSRVQGNVVSSLSFAKWNFT